ncbi:MAG: prephenate dehydrogenase [Planctomycetota bacterium]|nr:MAG: prephenate dehydrogenase [Planctomycetota bacterium]
MARWNTVAIVGVGLIGGSIGLALQKRKLAERVIGIGRRQVSLRAARRVGAVTNTTIELEKGVSEADLVIVCTPVNMIVEHVRQAAAACRPGTLITDAGSTKRSIVAALDGPLANECRFLGSHPLAGSEKRGPTHADADLFEGKICIVTPTANTRAEDYDTLSELWSSLGSVVMKMTPEDHDRAVALTSHLPHFAATTLAAAMPEEVLRISGTGLADTTRLAAGDPGLWVQIFSDNRQFVLEAVARWKQAIAALEQAIAAGDKQTMECILEQGKKIRDALGS